MILRRLKGLGSGLKARRAALSEVILHEDASQGQALYVAVGAGRGSR